KDPYAGEFVRRGGFTLIAKFAMESKRGKFEKEIFKELLKVIELGAFDERNFVKKQFYGLLGK
ncbi:MAG: hypothetical protein GXO57_02820, partial [Thermodesulfobacteria bacterium]|nr:hypothetical protein [Thermodesulfobacteriota bacterium]